MRFYFLLLFVLISNSLWSQHAKVTYVTKVNMNIDFSGNPNMPKDVAERIKKRMAEPQNFQLFFDQNQSVYKKEEALDAPQSGNGTRMMRFGSNSGEITHTNLATREQTTQQELFGKLFLIQNAPKSPQWNFSGETKQIGNYTAYEATYTHMKVPPRTRFSFGQRNNEEEEKPEKVEVTASVWFTPDIPIAAGPESYFGLPGLVLMVQDGNKTIVCTEVQMNSSEKVDLNPPKKGEKVTNEEFNKIQKEKAEEMRERFQNNRRGDNSRQIFIGR